MENTKQELVKKFRELKKYIDSVINNKKDKSHLQHFLLFQYLPFFEYTESIIILCEEKKILPASVILRSLVEGHLYVLYSQIGDSEKKLSIFAKDEFDTKLKTINGLLNLINKYPNLKSEKEDSLFNEKNLQKIKKRTQDKRDLILKSNNLTTKDELPHLENIAYQCDKAEIENSTPGHFERMYNLEYRYLSPLVHLNMEGLESFVKKDVDGNFILSELDNPNLIVSESVGFCVALVKDLYINKVIDGETPKIVSELEELSEKYLHEKNIV